MAAQARHDERRRCHHPPPHPERGRVPAVKGPTLLVTIRRGYVAEIAFGGDLIGAVVLALAARLLGHRGRLPLALLDLVFGHTLVLHPFAAARPPRRPTTGRPRPATLTEKHCGRRSASSALRRRRQETQRPLPPRPARLDQ